jgi:hypothetical protein
MSIAKADVDIAAFLRTKSSSCFQAPRASAHAARPLATLTYTPRVPRCLPILHLSALGHRTAIPVDSDPPVCSGEFWRSELHRIIMLARNARDRHHLIDLCALAGTLVSRSGRRLRSRIVTDRLLLGLKGTVSEYELSPTRQRGIAARDSKAKHGDPGSCLRAVLQQPRVRLIPTNTWLRIRLVS